MGCQASREQAILNLKQRINEVNQDKQKLTEEIEVLREIQKKKDEENEANQKKLAKLKEDQEEHQAKKVKHEHELKHKHPSLYEVREKVWSQEAKISTQKKETKSIQARIQEHENLIITLKVEIDEKQSDSAKVKAQADDLKDKIDSLDGIEDIKKGIEDEIEVLENSIVELEKSVQDLERNVDEKQKKNKGKYDLRQLLDAVKAGGDRLFQEIDQIKADIEKYEGIQVNLASTQVLNASLDQEIQPLLVTKEESDNFAQIKEAIRSKDAETLDVEVVRSKRNKLKNQLDEILSQSTIIETRKEKTKENIESIDREIQMRNDKELEVLGAELEKKMIKLEHHQNDINTHYDKEYNKIFERLQKKQQKRDERLQERDEVLAEIAAINAS